MNDLNIMSLPNELKLEGYAVFPSHDYKLTATIDGKTKTIIWKGAIYPSDTDGLSKDNANFLKLVKYVSDYVHSTKEYNKLPQPKGGYD